ncbi:MAG: autotransporter-associated beta strand repeat-containing protein [Paludibacter sp.]|nr:autotransporter-associated beta strand repeat-containing protein [Paludibacter sp.]
MRKLIFTLSMYCASLCLLSAQLVAFPGAEGFGKFAKGVRASTSPTVYHVTNLNDTGTGSFRDAVSASNRVVVFDVAGVIRITSRLVVSSNNYIAGQTAPGEGITIYGNGFSFTGADNLICRYLRVRMGNVGDSGKDACGIANGSNMIFDHISTSWGRDETFSINWDSKGSEPNNITIQNSIISQGLMAHSAGGLIQTNGGVTLYRNVYIDNGTRNNKIKGINQYVNNMVYNWEAGAYIMGGDSEGESFVNAVSNYFINGPSKGVSPFSVGNNLYHIFATDNWHDGDRNGKLDGYLIPESEFGGGPDFQAAPYAYPVVPTWPATVLPDSVLPAVGASLPYRDLEDYYVIDEFKSYGKKGYLITNETENSIGTPSQWTMWAGTKRIDTDNDGIPDAWETANGLNPALASDALALATNGYTNIENYINSITGKYSQDFLRAPLCLKTDSTSQNSISLSWFDFTEKEQGYCVEKKVKGTYTEITRTGLNGNTFTLNGLVPEEKDTIRVRAFNAGGYSAYSNELFVKTKPVPVLVLDPATYTPDLTWTGTASSDWEKTSNNWQLNNVTGVFADSSKVLFANSTAKTINITEPVAIKAMMVNADSSYVFQGASYITGSGSVNKTGSGNLALLTDNSYKGATVLWNGTLEINKLVNGGLSSSIGASQNYDFNLVLKGGKLLYTGASTSTDRNIALEGNPSIAVGNSASVVTVTGLLTGAGGFTKSGSGRLLLKAVNNYEGPTVISDGILELNSVPVINNGLGTSNILKLDGGTFKTTGGSNTVDEIYPMSIFVSEGKTSGFEPYRNCQITGKVSGGGILNFNISYVREYLTGDWSQFSGTVNANGIGTSTDGSQFMLNNTTGIPNARIVTSGNTKIVCWKNGSTMYLGGLSGPNGTYLAGSDKINNAATMTWIVGGAGTDETFNGIINNENSNKSYKGVTSIVKDGLGYWRLTGANIYSGTTTVKGGKLIVNGIQTGTGKTTVMQDGTLAGFGKIPAIVEVQSGGFIEPGDSTIGTLTTGSLMLLSGSQLNMDINCTSKQSDKIASSASIAIDGVLKLKMTGTPVAGDQFTLLTGTAFTGSFSQILPAIPGQGLVWSFANGVLSVVADVNGLESVDKYNVKIYPNPVTDKAVISLDRAYDRVEVSIETVSGSTLFTQQYKRLSLLNVDLTTLPKGFYIVRVKGDNELISTSKVMKK